MADIALRSYLEQLDSLIDQKRLDEVIAHCRHILTFYPKNLDTYRTLGKALLEMGKHGDAADIFQRVLSAMPDDFISHVGMSIVREDEANLEGALWHMERAFEVSPTNPAIQDELRRLYGRRDGVMPSRARLTRGALARMYAKGELYLQAESELKTALAEDQDRLDLSLTLAEVYHALGRHAEAADLCNDILHKLPYHLGANRLMADILKQQDRLNEAISFRQRLEALDPYESFAAGQTLATVNPEAVRIPHLDYDEAAALNQRPADDWSAFGADMATNASGGSDTDWLTMAGETPFASDLPNPAETPDWLQDIQPVAKTTPLSAPADIPDWMKATTGLLGNEPPKRTATGWLQVPETPAATPTSAEDTPGWLKDLGATATTPPSQPAPEADLPDWLKQASVTPPSNDLPDWMKTSTLSEPAAAPAPASDLPEWMKTSALTPPPAEAAPPPSDVPDWMKTSSLTLAPAPDSDLPAWMQASEQPSSQSAPADAVPDWMKLTGPFKPSETPAAPAEDDVPDWLKAATTGGLVAGAATLGAVAASESAAPAEDIPAWMKPAEAAAPAEDIPAWMKPAEAAAPAEPAPKRKATLADLPDFLQPASAEAIERANEQYIPEEGEEPESWLADVVKARAPQPADEASAVADIPDWVKAMAPSTDVPVVALTDAEPEIDQADIPDWLRPDQPSAPTPQESALADIAIEAGDIPDWLQPADTSSYATAPVSAESAAALPSDLDSDDAMRWLEQLALQQGANPDELVTDAKATAGLAEPAALPISPPAAALPSDLDSDDAMRWLEQLALQQGANPDELVTDAKATAGLAEPAADMPAWLKAAAPTDQPVSPPAAPAAATDDDDAMRWLEQLALQQGANPDELVTDAKATAGLAEPAADMPAWLKAAAPTDQPVSPPAAPAAATDDDDAMRWLEQLALQQGANPDELVTDVAQAETPRPTGPAMPGTGLLPEWLDATNEPEPPEEAPATPATDLPDWKHPTPALAEATSASDLPDWLKSAAPTTEAEPTSDLPDWVTVAAPPAVVEPPAPATPPTSSAQPVLESSSDRLARLADRLAANKRTKETEIAARFAQQRAEQEAAKRDIMEKMAERQRAVSEVGKTEAAPSAAPSQASAEPPPTAAPTAPVIGASFAARPPTPVPFFSAPSSVAATPSVPFVDDEVPPTADSASLPPALPVSPNASLPSAAFQQGQQALAQGRYAEAQTHFEQTLSDPALLTDVIVELEAALRDPDAPPVLYRVLGDAYLRQNQLQKALNAYRDALAHL